MMHKDSVVESVTDGLRDNEVAPDDAGPGWTLDRAFGYPLVFGVFVFGGWQLASMVGWLHPIVFPSPLTIIGAVGSVVSADSFPRHLRTTAIELAIGFSLAILIALTLGTLVALSRTVRLTVYPYVIALQAPPKVVFVPVFITWFGFGMASKIVVAVVIGFFPLFINTVGGLMRSDPVAENMLRALTATPRQIFFKLKFPAAMPMILAGVRVSWTLSVTGVIIAEFLGASAGIGYLIALFNSQLRIPQTFVLIALLSLFTVGVYKIIEAIERRVCFWA